MSIKIQRCFKGLYSPQQPSMAYKVSATTHPSPYHLLPSTPHPSTLPPPLLPLSYHFPPSFPLGVLASPGLATPATLEVDPGAFSGQNRDGRHPRGPSGSALLLCVAGVHCWEISLGLADAGNITFRLTCRFMLGFSCAYSLCIVA